MIEGFQESERKINLAEEIFRLTDGDPILVRMYVEKVLYNKNVSIVDVSILRRIQPGLHGYFERWWECY